MEVEGIGVSNKKMLFETTFFVIINDLNDWYGLFV